MHVGTECMHLVYTYQGSWSDLAQIAPVVQMMTETV